jgi:hypothetical protein
MFAALPDKTAKRNRSRRSLWITLLHYSINFTKPYKTNILCYPLHVLCNTLFYGISRIVFLPAVLSRIFVLFVITIVILFPYFVITFSL